MNIYIIIDRQNTLRDKGAFYQVGNDPADKGQVVIESQVLMYRYADIKNTLRDKVAFHWVGNDPADKGQVGID